MGSFLSPAAVSPRHPLAEEKRVQRGRIPLCQGDWGMCPQIPLNTPRAGGWEEPRLCCASSADAAHRPQRPPTTPRNETQTAKRATSRAACLPVRRRESAERENPSPPGVSGGVPLIARDFSRAGGWEEPRPCCASSADAAHRPQRPPTTPRNETQTAKRATTSCRRPRHRLTAPPFNPLAFHLHRPYARIRLIGGFPSMPPNTIRSTGFDYRSAA